MIYVQLPPEIAAPPRPLPFYLAMEEYLARNFSGEYFFMWQVSPTVIFGRNQVIDAEVNLAFCHENGISAYRRKSGGGCVYADMNNIMFSHITTSDTVATTFTRYTSMVADMLCELGVKAYTTGRNDIMIDNRKVSGYAFYHINIAGDSRKEACNRAIVHGTMLYDADLGTMMQALTPSSVKLEAKGVSSVRKHVTTIREHSDVSLDGFKNFARNRLCESCMQLDMEDVAEIERIARPYFTKEWIFGNRAAASRHDNAPERVEGVGEFVVDLRTDNGIPPRITSLDLKGDFFLTGDLDCILTPLAGCPLRRDDILKTLEKIETDTIIPHLTPDALAELILGRAEKLEIRTIKN